MTSSHTGGKPYPQAPGKPYPGACGKGIATYGAAESVSINIRKRSRMILIDTLLDRKDCTLHRAIEVKLP